MKRFYGNYLGIVIQNSDPEYRGRIKVWVPFISATIFEGWNQDRKDKKFKFLGKNINSPLSGKVLDELKNVLPWAEYVAPSMGASGNGTYSATKDNATISDSNTESNRWAKSDENAVFKKYRVNKDNVGEKSGKIYETLNGKVKDAFCTTDTGSNNVNPNSFNYKPSTYSNSAKGSFSIPNVGAHVMVFFLEGNPMYPYYFGVSFGQDDFASIFNPSQNQYEDYPQSYENKIVQSGDGMETYRNKYVFSQKGGTIEIVNTDNRESLKFTHYSGAFKEYNNLTGVEFLPANNQKLVLGDEFFTTNGHVNQFIGRDIDSIIKGNAFRKIGNLSKDLVNQWVSAYQAIADSKSLFEIRRAPFVSSRLSSPSQVRSGSFGNCPVCSGSGTVQGDTCATCGGTGQSPSSQNGTWMTETAKSVFNTLLQSKAQTLAEIERQMGRGGSEFNHISRHKIESVGLVLNKFNAVRIDPIGMLDTYATTVATDGIYVQKKEFAIFEKVHVDDLPGGTYTHFIGNKYDAVVGAGGYRVKTYGNLDISGSVTTLIGDQVIIGSANEVTIDGGKRTNIIGDSINLKSRLGKQISAEGNFGVTKNVVIGGGAHIDGELNVNHVTAPLEFQITEPVHIKTTFTITSMATTGLDQTGDSGHKNEDITAGTMTGTIELDVDHTHYFRNLPLTLVDGKTRVRNDSKNYVNTDSSTARESGDRSDGLKATFQSSNKGPDNGPSPH